MARLAAARLPRAWFRPAEEAATPRPSPRPRVAGPLLMSDILTSHRGEPVFLADWRAAQDTTKPEE